MYKVNDLIIYGNSGVCKIEGIESPDFAGADMEKPYYKLVPIHSKTSIIYAPVENSKVLMRRILTTEEVRKLISSIPSITIIDEENHKALAEKYQNAIKTNDCREWIKVIKTVYEKKQNVLSSGKKLGQIDKRYMKQAEDLLYGELAITLHTARENVEKYIVDRVIQLVSA